MLDRHSDLQVVGDASDGNEGFGKQKNTNLTWFLDISIPELNGLQAAPLIVKAAKNTEILIVTNHEHPFVVREAFEAGARGFLLKSDIARGNGNRDSRGSSKKAICELRRSHAIGLARSAFSV